MPIASEMTAPPDGIAEPDGPTRPRLHRLGERGRKSVPIEIDGMAAAAMVGDTVLTAILTHTGALRQSEFGDGPRAGFCLMGACQDCWVWLRDGTRLRACSTPVSPGLQILTREVPWPRV